MSMSSGAIHQTIYMPAAKDFHLRLPPRPAQEKLAARLDEKLAHAATILRSARAVVEALPAAALKGVFG